MDAATKLLAFAAFAGLFALLSVVNWVLIARFALHGPNGAHPWGSAAPGGRSGAGRSPGPEGYAAVTVETLCPSLLGFMLAGYFVLGGYDYGV